MRVRAKWRYVRHMRRLKRYLATLPEGTAEPLTFTDANSDLLLIAFGGLHRQIGIPPFEFMRLTGDLPVKRLFVRDPRQAWYHRGLPGYSETLTGSVDVLRGYAEAASRVVATGSSAGGYAALLYGTLLGVDRIIAFGPQTTLRLGELHAFGDRRWDMHLAPLFKAGVMDPQWVDLARLQPGPDADVYFDEDLDVDRAHAERIGHVATLHSSHGGGHDLVRVLRDRGDLARLLRAALDGAAA